MNPSERFFTKLRKLTVYLETESNSLLHASQNTKEDDEDAENGAQALYQLHSEVRQLKRQVQDQVGTQDPDSTELRTFIRRCLVLKQRTTEDLDRLMKHYEKYGYKPRKEKQDNTAMNSTIEIEEPEEGDDTHAAQDDDEEKGQGEYDDTQQSKTPEKIPPPSTDQLRTPKLSDFGLSALQFQRVFDEVEPSHDAPVPDAALSPPPFVMNMQPSQPKTPKCSLRMEEDALTPRLEDFGISEYTMCWNNDFTMDLFNKKPAKQTSKSTENADKHTHIFSSLSSAPNRESLESPEPPVFCTPGFKIEKHQVPSSHKVNNQNNFNSPPRQKCASTPEVPAFETPFVSKLLKKEERDRHRSSQPNSFDLPDPSDARSLSCDLPEMPKIKSYEEALPEMPTLQSIFGSSLGFKCASGECPPGMTKDSKQTPVPLPDECINQDWCLSTPKVRMNFPADPCTPEMPDISSVTQDILKLVAQCKS